MYREVWKIRDLFYMCASCWRVQPLAGDLGTELDQWVDPTTFMARGQLGSQQYDIIDEYAIPVSWKWRSEINSPLPEPRKSEPTPN